MRKYNFFPPLIILAVAFLTNNLTNTICLLLGASPETASNTAFGVMMIAVIITFVRLNKAKQKRRP